MAEDSITEMVISSPMITGEAIEGHNLFNMTAPQRNELVLKYASGSKEYQKELDDLLKVWVKQQPTLFLTYRASLAPNQGKQDKSKTKKAELTPEELISFDNTTKQTSKEFFHFWYMNGQRDTYKIVESQERRYRAKIADPTSLKERELEKLQELAYYIPKLVLRRLFKNKKNISPPESESYPAAVIFADISGFTPLTEKLANRGLEGIEQLTTELNTYFKKLTDIIDKHGGDILKFAGDAVLVVWPIGKENVGKENVLGGVTLLACQASKTLLDELGNYKVESADGSILTLHIGIGCGMISGIHIGGVEKRCEFFISGSVLEQVSSCEKEASPGEAYISKIALDNIQKGRISVSQKSGNTNYLLESIDYPMDLPGAISFPLYPDMEPNIQLYLQQAVLLHAKSGAVRSLAELRTISVIFLNLTSPFKDEKLSELQQTISEMQTVIEKYEGTIRQFMIDDKGSVLIVGFGLPPKSHNDDPVRALRTAIDLLNISKKLNVPASIGVTTGKAFCGDVGSKTRKEYAMVGDIVNLSARLMVASKQKGGLLCDIDTFEAAKNSKAVTFKKLDEIKVKGKTHPIPIFIPSHAEISDSKSSIDNSVIVGRDNELKTLDRLIAELQMKLGISRASASTPQARVRNRVSAFSGNNNPNIPRNVCLILGDEGSGKTRLLHYVEQRVRANKAKILVVTADSINTSTQYYAWTGTFQTILEKGKLPVNIINEIGAERAPLLNFMLPQPLEETSAIAKMSAQLRSETTKEILTKLLEQIAIPGTCILIDNAHWLDTASWSLLSTISTLDDILLVIAVRKFPRGKLPLQYNQLASRFNVVQINLENLSAEDTTKLIASRLEIKKVPPLISSEIYNKSQGNPYITEEIVNALRDSKTLPPPNKNGEVSVNAEVERILKQVPSSLNGLLTSKIDKLSPSSQLILKVASVIGEKVSLELLNQLLKKETGKEAIDLNQDLDSLIKANVLSKDEDKTYSFTNVLLRDAVYNIMLFSQKRELHSILAEYITKTYPGMPKYYASLAHHYKQASGEDPKEEEPFRESIEYYEKAGSISLYSYANKEATEFFREALKLIEKTDRKNNIESISMSRKLGQAFYNLGQFTEADNHLRKALGKMGIEVPTDNSKTKPNSGQKQKVNNWKFGTNGKNDITHRKREAGIVLLALSKLNFYACNRNIASWCVGVALQLEDTVGPALAAESHALNALSCSFNNDFKTAEEEIHKALEKANAQVDVEKTIYEIAGMIACSSAQWDKAEQAFNKSLDCAKTVGDLRTFEELTVLIGTLHYFRGEVAKSAEITKDAIRSAKERGDIQSQVLALNAQARNFYVLGENEQCLKCLHDVELALEFLKPPLNSSNAICDMTAQINYYGLRALMELRLRNVDAAFENADQLNNIFKEKEVTVYFTFDGYASLVEFYLLFLQQFKLWRKTDNKKKLLSKAEKALSYLTKFAQIFGFAQPRNDLWKGQILCHNKKSKYEEDFKRSEETAIKLGMNYEKALCFYERSIISGARQDFDKACEIFPEIKLRATALPNTLRDIEEIEVESEGSSIAKTLEPSKRNSISPTEFVKGKINASEQK